MTELVTIITLTYNSKDLKPTIDSVLKQNYPRIQYIICDDHSTNLDLQYWERYINTNNRGNIVELLILTSDVNQGIIRNSNKARRFAKGKYIFACAHDDELNDEYVITDWVSEFIRTGADVVSGKRAVYDENMQDLLYYAPNEKEITYFNGSSEEIFENLALHKNFIFGASTARTKESLEKFGYYDETFKNIEDYSMYLKISRLGGKIVYFDRLVLKYRSGGISSPKNMNKDYFIDEDIIVEKEILPYTKYPKEVIKKHKDFKKNTIIYGRELSLKQKYGESIVPFYKVYTWIRYPFFKIRTKIQRSMENDEYDNGK